MSKKVTVSVEEARELIKQRNEIAKRLTGPVLIQVLLEDLRPVFDANPKLKTVSWDQYGPSFADGDVSEFYVSEEPVLNEGDNEEEEVTFPQQVYDEVAKILGGFTNDDFELMFGTDTTVIVNRSGKVKQRESY